MTFRVADIQACYELWKSRGAEFITEPIPKYGETRCYIRDPDGYIIYAEVVDAVVRAGDTDLDTVKTRAGIASPALAAIAPFNKVPFVPVLNAKGSDIAAVTERQTTNARPVAFELPHMLSADVPKIVAVGRQHGIKLFSNTLGDGFCIGIGGDNDALKDSDTIWGWLYRNGISIFQTDRPEALLEFRTTLHK
jgi:glycerophosphoryl diester phosphodiesterase